MPSESLELSDGRTLSYATFGATDGTPVVVLDGPGSRGLAQAMSGAAGAAGLRLIAPDRPGFLESSPRTSGRIAGWPADHAALLDALGVDAAPIVGQSGGTPYALGTAAALPHRVSRVALLGATTLAGAKPLAGVRGDMKLTFRLGMRAPGILKRLLVNVAKDPDKAAARMARRLPPKDAEVMADPEFHAMHVRATHEILAGAEAMHGEVVELVRPWPFDVASVTQPVAFWVGTADTTHPPQMTHKLAAQLGTAEIHEIPGVGTFGLRDEYPEVLSFVSG